MFEKPSKAFILLFLAVLLLTCKKKQTNEEKYVCPMFCDSLVYDTPGKCTICEMDLVLQEKQNPLIVQNHHHSQEPILYTCPMHPEIIRNEPGNCPICGMQLVAKTQSKMNDAYSNTGDLSQVNASVNAVVLSQAVSVMPTEENASTDIEMNGYISYNPDEARTIASRFAGRIDKLFLKYNYEQIKAGQKLMEIYSPELVNTQEDYLQALKKNDTILAKQAENKLRQLGLNNDQFREIKKSGKALQTVTLYSPYHGHVHEPVPAEGLTMPVMDMQPVKDNNTKNQPLALRLKEGMFVEKGQVLFDVTNTSLLWAILKVKSGDLSRISKGAKLVIYAEGNPADSLMAKVDFIEPELDQDAPFANIRAYLQNCEHSKWYIGKLIWARVQPTHSEGLYLPQNAVLDLGNQVYLVFKKEPGGIFRATHIKGYRIPGRKFRVTEGISVTDEVAAEAGYLVDSEGMAGE